MHRSRRLFALVLATVAVTLAACSGPQAALNEAPYDDVALTLGTSSKLSWSYGSAILSGQISGLGRSAGSVDVEGVTLGWYQIDCVNTKANPNDKEGNAAPGLAIDASAHNFGEFPVERNGVVKFVDGNFTIENPTADDLDAGALCPNGKNWRAVPGSVFFITDIFLRYGTLPDDYTAISWTCRTEPSADSPSGATMTCDRDVEPRDYWAL